jgi:hypothetical protein
MAVWISDKCPEHAFFYHEQFAFFKRFVRTNVQAKELILQSHAMNGHV